MPQINALSLPSSIILTPVFLLAMCYSQEDAAAHRQQHVKIQSQFSSTMQQANEQLAASCSSVAELADTVTQHNRNMADKLQQQVEVRQAMLWLT